MPFYTHARDNNEIQVYSAETVEKGNKMVELRSKFTIQGQNLSKNGVLPTHYVFHAKLKVSLAGIVGLRLVFYF